MRRYILRNIRTLLLEGFRHDTLVDFIFFEPKFRAVYDQIADETGKAKLVRLLLEYAEDQMLINELLDWARKENPARYDAHQPYDWTESEDVVANSEFATRKRLLKFLNLEVNSPKEITIYLSRHSARIQLPEITTVGAISEEPVLEKLSELYKREVAEQPPEDIQLIRRPPLTMVSPIEMVEAIRLIKVIDRSNLLDWFSRVTQKKLKESRIKVNLDECPRPDEYEKMLKKGTLIFIGGSRANLGTHYYLDGIEAGEVRPGRLEKHRNQVEFVKSMGGKKKGFRCLPKENLGIIQRHKTTTDQLIIYLAGTGLNGTAAAVAYMRQKWLDLRKAPDNFSKVIKVPARNWRDEDLSAYISKDWTDHDWIELDEDDIVTLDCENSL